MSKLIYFSSAGSYDSENVLINSKDFELGNCQLWIKENCQNIVFAWTYAVDPCKTILSFSNDSDEMYFKLKWLYKDRANE